jgi:hypothetical protein
MTGLPYLIDSNVLLRWIKRDEYILTFNEKDFARYTDIEAVHPLSKLERS